MKKLTKLQKEWVESFKQGNPPYMHLLHLLVTLRIINWEKFYSIKDHIIDNVRTWEYNDRALKLFKARREEARSHYDNKPIKKLKSDTKYR